MGSRAKRHTVDLLSKLLGTLCCWCRHPLEFEDSKDPHYRSIEHMTPQKLARLDPDMRQIVESFGNKALSCRLTCNCDRNDAPADEYWDSKRPERARNRKLMKHGRLR